VAVEDGLDLSTDTGKLVLRLMLSLGEWELDRVRTTWRTAQERAIARRVHIGPAPIGYRRRDDGRLVPDPLYGPVITELFHRRAEGAATGQLCRLLTERGVPTPAGARIWGRSTMDGVLRSGPIWVRSTTGISSTPAPTPRWWIPSPGRPLSAP
jgi:DNA invertase Pin-like site-specific DNA recombinase